MEEIFQRASVASEVWHARTARARRAIAHLLGRLAARIARSSLRCRLSHRRAALFMPSRQAQRAQGCALARCCSTTSSPEGTALPSPRQRAATGPSPRPLPVLSPRFGAHPLIAALSRAAEPSCATPWSQTTIPAAFFTCLSARARWCPAGGGSGSARGARARRSHLPAFGVLCCRVPLQQ